MSQPLTTVQELFGLGFWGPFLETSGKQFEKLPSACFDMLVFQPFCKITKTKMIRTFDGFRPLRFKETDWGHFGKKRFEKFRHFRETGTWTKRAWGRNCDIDQSCSKSRSTCSDENTRHGIQKRVFRDRSIINTLKPLLSKYYTREKKSRENVRDKISLSLSNTKNQILDSPPYVSCLRELIYFPLVNQWSLCFLNNKLKLEFSFRLSYPWMM